MKPGKIRVGGPDPLRVFAGIVVSAVAFVLVIGRPAIEAPARKRRVLAALMPAAASPSAAPTASAASLPPPARTSPSPGVATAAVITPAVVVPEADASPAASPSPAPSTQPRSVTFEELGGFEMPAVPASIRALDGQDVTIQGYVMPMKMEGHRIVAFMLMSSMPNCCFGGEPRLNDWVMVGVPPALDVRASDLGFAKVTGRLSVREVKDKRGEVLGLYALKASAVAASDGPGSDD